MKLIINHRHIKSSIKEILSKVKDATGFLDDIQERKENVICTCPFHNDGHEKKPACYVKSTIDGELEYGTFHCFACGESGRLPKLIAKCFNCSFTEAEKWLTDNFGNVYVEDLEYLPKIESEQITNFLPESILNSFEYDNKEALNYLINKRHLKKEVLDKFKIGFEKSTNSVTFPCRDEHGNLVGIFKRNIYTKFFTIPKIEPKPIFLLDNAIKNGYDEVVVCESQINALTLEGWGFHSIALFGTGSDAQYSILSKSGIRKYILAFDGDLAGDIGAKRFSLNVKNAVFEKINIPKGKDVNDLTFEEFCMLQREII